MNNILSAITSNFLIYVSLLFCIIAAIKILAFVIPLQVKQAGVHNGLAMLRKQLLMFGIVVFITTSIASVLLFRLTAYVFFPENSIDFFTHVLIFIFSLSKLLIAQIGQVIYHQQYVLEHKA